MAQRCSLQGFLLFFFLFMGCTQEEPYYYSRETRTKSYSDVMAELELAITERNYRITGHNKIGSVIRERDQIDFPDYDTFQFCNLTLAREMLELSPESVSWMPCNMALRVENEKVILTTHLLKEDPKNPKLAAFAKKINAQLKEIVDFAVEN